MKNFFLSSSLILVSLFAFGQTSGDVSTSSDNGVIVGTTDVSQFEKPKGRLKTKTNQGPQDSSSFVGDPDNLDPLKANRDNLKEDAEPILEDIKDVLNSKSTEDEKKSKETSTAATASPSDKPKVTKSASTAKPKAKPKKAKKPIKQVATLTPDDPDFALEKKFHNIYQSYNKNPTPADVWAAASSKQTAREYEVQKGDTLWSISKILFDDPNFWPKLWSVNRQGILNPHFINPKMKIYFYEGTDEYSPTLSVGQLSSSGEASTEDYVQTTSKSGLSSIPPSLPEGVNANYLKTKSGGGVQIRIELGAVPQSQFYYNNDIVITDIDVQGEVQLQLSEVQKLRCAPGRLFKDITYKGSLVDDYDIYERLEGVDTVTGYKYSYRYSGRAKAYKEKYLRVIDCKSFIGTDLVIIPRNQMKELATQKVSDSPDVTFIGGPDVRQQKYYSIMQYAYVDFGLQQYNVGQDYRVVSEITDKVNGEFKVVEKFGSYAVVIITEVADQLSIGDKVNLQ